MEEMQVSPGHCFDGTLMPNNMVPCLANMPASTPAGLPVASKDEYEALVRKKVLEERIKNGIGLDWQVLTSIGK